MFFAIIAVWVGNHFLGLTGALTGGVIGVLIGFDHIRRGDRLAVSDVEDARNEIPRQLAHLHDLGMDGLFSETEEATGHPDSPDVLALADRPKW